MNRLELTRFPDLEYACKEAINTLCTNLSFAGSEKRKVMITSTREHEGKSFLTMNIMRTLAQLGKRVVLMDGDLRRSQIRARYGMRILEGRGYGATHYLAGMCDLDDVIYATDIPGAYIVPVGREVSNSLALLSNRRLSQMLSQLAANYDFVLVDAPPVGAIIDAAEIAKFCDGTIIAVKYNCVSRRELVEVRTQIERAGCEVLGAVLNEVSFDSLSSKKYYNKSYYARFDSEYYRDSGRRGRSGASTAARDSAASSGRRGTTAGNKAYRGKGASGKGR